MITLSNAVVNGEVESLELPFSKGKRTVYERVGKHCFMSNIMIFNSWFFSEKSLPVGFALYGNSTSSYLSLFHNHPWLQQVIKWTFLKFCQVPLGCLFIDSFFLFENISAYGISMVLPYTIKQEWMLRHSNLTLQNL